MIDKEQTAQSRTQPLLEFQWNQPLKKAPGLLGVLLRFPMELHGVLASAILRLDQFPSLSSSIVPETSQIILHVEIVRGRADL